MGKMNIVLADLDERYLQPLEIKFIEEFQDRADIVVITDQGYLRQFFSAPKNIDILIINESLYTELLEKHNITNIFILTESYVENKTDNLHLQRIYKYTSVKEIYTEVMVRSKSKRPSSTGQSLQSKVIMVYSPSGGTGKTTVALGLCAALARTKKTVLYINTEPFQNFGLYLDNTKYIDNSPKNTDFLKKENILDSLDRITGTQEFAYVLPLQQSPSAFGFDFDDYNYFVENLRKANIYEYIIIDTSNEFTPGKTRMMSIADKTLIITMQDAISATKLACMLNDVDCSDTDKFMFICNKYEDDKRNCLLNAEELRFCTISEYIAYQNFPEKGFKIKSLADNVYFRKLAIQFV